MTGLVKLKIERWLVKQSWQAQASSLEGLNVRQYIPAVICASKQGSQRLTLWLFRDTNSGSQKHRSPVGQSCAEKLLPFLQGRGCRLTLTVL